MQHSGFLMRSSALHSEHHLTGASSLDIHVLYHCQVWGALTRS